MQSRVVSPAFGCEKRGQDDPFGVGCQFDAVAAGSVGVGVGVVAQRVEPVPQAALQFGLVAGSAVVASGRGRRM